MGSPNSRRGAKKKRPDREGIDKAEVVLGDARIPCKDIFAEEWCRIIGTALFRISSCLKYVTGFNTLGKLLNGELLRGYRHFATSDEAMPTFEGTDLTPKARFIALQQLCPGQPDSANGGHEIGWKVLLLTDKGNFAILELSFFQQGEKYAVCGSSLTTTSTALGYRSVLGPDTPEIRELISNGSICPSSLLSVLHHRLQESVWDREKRLDSVRHAEDTLKGVCERLSR